MVTFVLAHFAVFTPYFIIIHTWYIYLFGTPCRCRALHTVQEDRYEEKGSNYLKNQKNVAASQNYLKSQIILKSQNYLKNQKNVAASQNYLKGQIILIRPK